MKKFLAILFVFSSFPAIVSAQMSNDEIAMLQSLYGMNKRDLVTKYMKFTPAQDSVFWPVYDAYEAERKQLGETRIRLIEDYAKNYTSFTNEKADELVKKNIELEISSTKLLEKYYGKMKKEVGSLRAAQFIQLENYLNNVIKTEIQSEIPFIGEIDRK